MFARFAIELKRLGANGMGAQELSLGHQGRYDLQYIPFEHVNANARLVIVGITPGNNQLELAYSRAQQLLETGASVNEILIEIKKAGSFGGPAMKPNLLKLLRHFHFDKLLCIDDVTSLWAENAELLHSTSTVPHAAFKNGKMFAGTFDEIMASSLLKECFIDCFVPSAKAMNKDALFVGLGQCPQAALEWCVREGVLSRKQVLGSFCHPSTSGGSTVKFYLREVSRKDLKSADPVLNRVDWLDQAYDQMRCATTLLLDGVILAPIASKALPPTDIKKTADKTQKPKKKKSTIMEPVAFSDAVEAVLQEVKNADYVPVHFTKKITEIESPGGESVYLENSSLKLNNIILMVHPRHASEALRKIEGVDSVSAEHRFHANMKKFPKRINTGNSPTTFGWQVKINTLADLQRFLKTFDVKWS